MWDVHVRGIPEDLLQAGGDEGVDLGVQNLSDVLRARNRQLTGGGRIRFGAGAIGRIGGLGAGRLGRGGIGLGARLGLDSGAGRLALGVVLEGGGSVRRIKTDLDRGFVGSGIHGLDVSSGRGDRGFTLLGSGVIAAVRGLGHGRQIHGNWVRIKRQSRTPTDGRW